MTPEDALDKLLRIARGESRESFMSIPARPDVDADLVLAKALRERETALAALDKAEEENAKLRWELQTAKSASETNTLARRGAERERDQWDENAKDLCVRLDASIEENARLREALVEERRQHEATKRVLANTDVLRALDSIPDEEGPCLASPTQPAPAGERCHHLEHSFGHRSCMRCGHEFPKEEWTK